MVRGSFLIAVGVTLSLFAADLLAHDVRPRPVADFLIKPDGERLTVTAHLPVVVLADVNLPRDAEGHLVRSDLDRPLQIVAREVAASLEFAQSETPLPMPTLRATLTPDDAFVDVELGYLIRSGAGNLSARLRTFRAAGAPVPVVARFVVPPGISRRFEVSEGSERVTFDPGITTAIAYFVGRGARTLLDDWDVVLFAICLVVPARAMSARRSAVRVLLTSQVIAVSVTAAARLGLQAAVPPLIMAIAASVIVIASLQAIVNPHSGALTALALLFGLANGVTLDLAFEGAVASAGEHAVAAFLTFLSVVVLEQVWIIALLSAAVALLYRWGLPVRVAVIGAAVCVCHEALDRVFDRAALLAQSSTISVEHFLITLVVAWGLAVIAAGLFSGDRVGGSTTPRITIRASARP